MSEEVQTAPDEGYEEDPSKESDLAIDSSEQVDADATPAEKADATPAEKKADAEEAMEEGEADKLGHLVPAASGSSSTAVEAEMSEVVVSNEQLRGWAAVRDVYRRAATTHCARKAVIRMKWAQFEENIGGVEEAREILRQLVEKYPMLLEARMQQIDLERRQRKFDVAVQLYQRLMKQIPSKHEKYKRKV